MSVLGTEFDLRSLPLPALLNVTWVLTLAIALRYCQTTVWVDRQYPYLHDLEAVISSELGGGNIYHREGKVYLSEYPVVLDVAWIAYVFLFPLIVMCATAALVCWEWRQLPYPVLHRLFDSAIALALIAFFFFYRVHPYLASRWKNWRERRRSSK